MDPSNKNSAKRTLLLAAVRRFLTLRKEVRACSPTPTHNHWAPAYRPTLRSTLQLAGSSEHPSNLLHCASLRSAPLRPTPLQYPPSELPTYGKKSSHLRGRDGWLVDRVSNEFLHAYSQVGSGRAAAAAAAQRA